MTSLAAYHQRQHQDAYPLFKRDNLGNIAHFGDFEARVPTGIATQFRRDTAREPSHCLDLGLALPSKLLRAPLMAYLYQAETKRAALRAAYIEQLKTPVNMGSP